MYDYAIIITINLMYELKKNWKAFTSKFVMTGPLSYEKRIYRAAVSQRLRNTALRKQFPGTPRIRQVIPTASLGSLGKRNIFCFCCNFNPYCLVMQPVALSLYWLCYRPTHLCGLLEVKLSDISLQFLLLPFSLNSQSGCIFYTHLLDCDIEKFIHPDH